MIRESILAFWLFATKMSQSRWLCQTCRPRGSRLLHFLGQRVSSPPSRRAAPSLPRCFCSQLAKFKSENSIPTQIHLESDGGLTAYRGEEVNFADKIKAISGRVGSVISKAFHSL
ncbi:hypothetical protein CLAIMM_12767 [Cladophialophora immunda]|nr:hypothetical protein CLAIMM_12767 [Cladophialophora immunda]